MLDINHPKYVIDGVRASSLSIPKQQSCLGCLAASVRFIFWGVPVIPPQKISQ